jgi:phosphonoacetate hydrolase
VTAVEVNGRMYRTPSTRSAVVCLDGCDPSYLDDAFERRIVPRLTELAENGVYALGRSQLPSFTNPNNLSIVTGTPPSGHGLPGNHYLAPDGEEVQLVDPSFLRAPSIHAAFAAAGVEVLSVTTKDKLRRLLAAGNVPCVSAERADEQGLDGVDPVSDLVAGAKPDIYDWDCSHYALELGLALADRLGTRLLYVSLTDFVQHADAPGGELSDRYLVLLDELVGRYLDEGWRLALVADHGMNAKALPDGRPNVRYLGDVLDQAGIDAHVVLPITDPYVVHHAALGSACWVHVGPHDLDLARALIALQDGIEEVIDREQAVTTLSLPGDRIGDLVVLADAHTAIGRRRREHDLSTLPGPLRSHGGRHEQQVPILLSERPDAVGEQLLADGATNADIHQLLLGTAV